MNNSRENEEKKRFPNGRAPKDPPSLRKRNEMWDFEAPYFREREEMMPMDYGPGMRPPPYYMGRRSRPGSRWGRYWEPHPDEFDWYPPHHPRRPERMPNPPAEFNRRRPEHFERVQKWEHPGQGRGPLQLEEEFEGVNMSMRGQLFRENPGERRRKSREGPAQRNNFNMELIERELENEMKVDQERHLMEMYRRPHYAPPYRPFIEDADDLRPGGRRRMPWTENWDPADRGYPRKGWPEDSRKEFEGESPKMPSVAQYEEMLRERDRLLETQRKKDLEIEKYRRQLERLEAGESRPPRKDHSNEPPKGLRELPRRKSAEVESELLGVKVISVAKAGSFLSMSKERASHEKPSSQAKNYQENPEYVGFKRINLDQSENPHPRVRIRYSRMNDINDPAEKSDSEPARNFSRVEVKVTGDRVQVIKNEPGLKLEDAPEEVVGEGSEPEVKVEVKEEVFEEKLPGEDANEDFGEDLLRPKKIKSEDEEKRSEQNPNNGHSRRSQRARREPSKKSGEFRLKIAKKSGAIRISDNPPQMPGSLKNLNLINRRSLSLEDIEPEELLGNRDTLDKTTQTKENPVINFLGQHSMNKLSSILKKNEDMTENQMLYVSQKRGKGRPHKNKENAPFHCLLNKDKETIITEELDNIISSFVVCSLQDKHVSLKIKDFSFWMKNRLFEVISTNETFETQSLNLMDLTPEFLHSVSGKLLEKCFNQRYTESLKDFRGVFMLDFLVYNTIKTRLITETVSLNFNTLNRLRNSQELTLPMVLASFVFLVSNFLIPSKFEMFYTYSCFLFSTLFQHSISSCILHLSGRSTQLEFSIQKLVVAANTAQEDIESAYQQFVNGGSPFDFYELKTFIESEKQLQFNSLLVHYIGIFAMLLE